MDMVKAVEWYQKAADQGYVDAQYAIGECYQDGYGVEMDKEKALNVDIFGGKKLFDNYYGNFTSLPEALFYETTTLDLPTPLDLGRDTFVVFIIALLATIWVLFIDYVGEKALDPIFHFDISRQTGLGTLSDIVKGSDDASFIDAAPSAPPLIP